MEAELVGGGSTTCHWLLTICGVGDITFTQLSKTKFVRTCNWQPADQTGHDSVRFVPASVKLMDGRGESAI